jgi:hypothetical protein
MNFQRFFQNQAISNPVSQQVSGSRYGTHTPFLRADLLPMTLPLTSPHQESLSATRQHTQVLSILASFFAHFWTMPNHSSATGAVLDEQQK